MFLDIRRESAAKRLHLTIRGVIPEHHEKGGGVLNFADQSCSALLSKIGMKIQELRKKSKDELEKMLQDKKAQVVNLKINIYSGNIKNVKELREVKRDVAKVFTLLNE